MQNPKVFRATLACEARNRLNYWREAVREARRLMPVIRQAFRTIRDDQKQLECARKLPTVAKAVGMYAARDPWAHSNYLSGL